MESLDRRKLLRQAGGWLGAVSIAAPLQAVFGGDVKADDNSGYGPLVPDPEGILDLPRGFKYQVLSRTGDRMSDGYVVPGLPDGMAAFAGENGQTRLVRNHEISPDRIDLSPFPPGIRKPENLYDPVGIAGTTTVVIERDGQLARQFVSLAGTVRNCAGGSTPWGSWISCEETVGVTGSIYPTNGEGSRIVRVERSHGYNFEVPASAEGPVAPIPLVAMGRFFHEAVAVDPRTGWLYQSEDRGDGAFYRFRPNAPGRLIEGGTLEVLAFTTGDMRGISTSNWADTPVKIAPRRPYPVTWLPITDVDPPSDTMRLDARSKGAALFSRGEGIHWSRGAFYFTCTDGGPAKRGQIWRLTPGAGPEQPDTLELFVEVSGSSPLKNPDNICISRSGELILCEDTTGETFLVGGNRDGNLYRIARNALNQSEFAGATFSPDGRTLFVNIMNPGLTLSITGPWH